MSRRVGEVMNCVLSYGLSVLIVGEVLRPAQFADILYKYCYGKKKYTK